MSAWVGGSTTTSPRWMAFASSSSHRQVRVPRSRSARDYVSAADLESALRRAEAAHREHEKRNGRSHLFHRSDQDTNWPAWYAYYMVAEQAGTDQPS